MPGADNTMPIAILRRLAEVRKDGTEPTLRPDAEKPAFRAL